jgi:carbon storage regulator
MLIITRKLQESFVIGDGIEIFILDVQNDKVKIGINAPKEVSILRKELYDTQNSNQEAVGSANKDKFNALKLEFKKKK